jgi:hypothetical protein
MIYASASWTHLGPVRPLHHAGAYGRSTEEYLQILECAHDCTLELVASLDQVLCVCVRVCLQQKRVRLFFD